MENNLSKRIKCGQVEEIGCDISDFDNSVLKFINEFDINALETNKLSSPIRNANFNDTPIRTMSLTEKLKKQLMEQNNLTNKSLSFKSDIYMPQIDFISIDTSFYGLPCDVKHILKKNYDIATLYDWQIKCLEFSDKNKESNLICSLPTSGGKTLVAELMILKEILCFRKNALFVLPYISIVQEKIRKMSVYADKLGFLLEEYAGNKGHFPPKVRRNKQTLYVATIEKASSLIEHFLETTSGANKVNYSVDLMDRLGIVVIDELHMVGVGAGAHRSSIVEDLITKIRYYDANKRYTKGSAGNHQHTKLVGMSATLPTCALGLCPFMGALTFSSDFRPVELKEYVKMNEEIYVVQNKSNKESPTLEFCRKLSHPVYYNARLKELDPEQIFTLVAETVALKSAQDENTFVASSFDGSVTEKCVTSCLVFCPTKKNCENVASNLARIAEVVMRRRRRASKMLNFIKNYANESPKGPRSAQAKSPCNNQKQRIEKLKVELKTLPKLDYSDRTLELRHQLIKNLTSHTDRTSTSLTLSSFIQHDNSTEADTPQLQSGKQPKESGKICPILKRAIRYGIAYHHSGLMTDERKLIEEAYSAGVLSVLCCTSTLAAGVNLPAKRVILKSPNIGNTTLNSGQYRQMIGRAGRAGLINDVGESFLILNDPGRQKDTLNALLGDASSTTFASGMAAYDQKGFKSLFLSAIGLKIATTEEELARLYSKTLYAHQLGETGSYPDDSEESIVTTISIIKELRESKLIYHIQAPILNGHINNDASYCVTKLGRAIYRSTIDQKFSTKLYRDLRKAQEVMVLSSHLHLLYLVTPYEINGINTKSLSNIDWNTYVTEVNQLTPQELKVMEVIGVPESYLIRQMTCQGTNKNVDPETVNRFYCTLMLYRLWKNQTFWDVSLVFQVDRGFVQNLFQSSSSFAYSVFNFTMEFDEFWALRELLEKFVKEFHHLVSKDLMPLIDLPGVKIGRIRQLFNAGYRSLIQVAQAKPDDLVKDIKFLPRKLAQEIIASAKMLLRERAESLEDEAINILSQLALC